MTVNNRNSMRRYNKNFKYSPEFIEDCMRDFMLSSNGKSRWKRKDVAYFYAQYMMKYFPERCPKTLHKTANVMLQIMKHRRDVIYKLIPLIAKDLYEELNSKTITLKPIEYQYRFDNTSGKMRNIGISSIKQQIFDYIAVNSCKEMFDAKIGKFQCASLVGKGTLYGVKTIEKWIRTNPKECRWAYKCDIRHYYPSINHDILLSLLQRDIKNKDCLYLLDTLISSYKEGLCIGSYLSQYLANYYLSYAYHYVSEQCFKMRKYRKDPTDSRRVNLVKHVLFYMDDIILIGSSRKDILKAGELLEKYLNTQLDLKLKPNKQLINLKDDYIDMMGYRISKECTTIRRRTFRLARRLWIRYKDKKKFIPLSAARRIMSYYGYVKHSNSRRIIKKYNIFSVVNRARKVVKEHDKRVHRKTTSLQVLPT